MLYPAITLPLIMQTFHNKRRWIAVASCLLALVATMSSIPAKAQTQPADKPQTTPTMPIADVRIGMKGYGLTVFHGTKIEPFPVEVISIVGNNTPKRSVIWIRCPDERMLESGPVQGMSGSPIFLWEDGEPQVLGQGGKLIGAFAFGFSLVKQCLVGVQPIAYMREIGRRAVAQNETDHAQAANAGASIAGQQTLDRLANIASAETLDEAATFRLRAMQHLLNAAAAGRVSQPRAVEAPNTRPTPAAPSELAASGQVMPMLLPMTLESPELARLVNPLIQPMGLTAVAGGQGLVSGPPPASIDAASAKLEPGSVLAVPLAYGDLDLSAAGTVTDVLPDGTVLGFGHAMYGQGPATLPMATGFVHFVVPRLDISFKLAGSLNVAGSIVQDEATGIAGIGEKRFETAPVDIVVDMVGQPQRSYHYQVVNHPQLTPMLATIVTLRSVSAIHERPDQSTLYLDGELKFTGNRTLKLDTIIAGGGALDAMLEMLPPIAMAMQNPHQPLKLEAVKLNARVTSKLRSATLVNARLDRTQVAPGESVGMNIWVQPFGQPMKRYRTQLKVPASVPEGDYPLSISGASTHTARMMMTRPHLFVTHSVDDLMDMTQRVLAVKKNAIYVSLQLAEQGIAVGRQELPQLPSSRRAMIFTPASTIATPYMETADQQVDTDNVIDGDLTFMISVRNTPAGLSSSNGGVAPAAARVSP